MRSCGRRDGCEHREVQRGNRGAEARSAGRELAVRVMRPGGWPANPQAMAAVSKRQEYAGSALLSDPVDADTWLTPRYILDQLGEFDLDPCAAACNPHWVSKGAMTVLEDGLRQPWLGRVFMNPPFSDTRPWLEKHADHGNGISLVPASVESRVWRSRVWSGAAGILLLHGRTRFCNPDGSSTKGRPLRSVALIAWTPEDLQALRDSTLAGVMLEKWSQK